ncbi:MAG: cysteine desulfurase [Oscillospiraceae bacterium]|nr:cysteine desulfurase [Oscillospiraceae bacterium]
MPYLYFDSAATAPPCMEALSAVTTAYEAYGNPSSLHAAGMQARRLVEDGRAGLARAFRCEPRELIFTSSGTESNNQALFGLAKLRGKRARTIISTNSEHPSVENPLRALEEQGFTVKRLSTAGGVLDYDGLKTALVQTPVAFVTMMQANNETGAVYDLPRVKRILEETGSDALLHCDAVQGFLKVEGDRLSACCDVVTLSAHKIGGVKGAGALYIGKRAHALPPLLLGGGQENGLRSGTENVAAIAAFGAAAAAASGRKDRLPYLASLREEVLRRLQDSGLLFHLPERHLPNILHLSIPGVPSSWALNFLSERGICVSAGSACSAREKKKGNPVLKAYGLPDQEIETSLRISFCEQNTMEECAVLCDALRDCAKLKR